MANWWKQLARALLAPNLKTEPNMTQKTEDKSNRFNWGTGLTIAIVLFICTTLGVVAYIISLDYHMVNDNHYEKAVNYQEHIDRVEQTNAMEMPVEIELMPAEGNIEIRFPQSVDRYNLKGTVELYRPSNPSLDQSINLMLGDGGIQQIPAGDLVKGKWLVKVTWSTKDQKYYKQQNIFL